MTLEPVKATADVGENRELVDMTRLRLTPASVALFRASGDTPEKTGVRVCCSTVELSRTRWKAKFGRMDVSEARKLKTLKTENSRLKMLLSLP